MYFQAKLEIRELPRRAVMKSFSVSIKEKIARAAFFEE